MPAEAHRLQDKQNMKSIAYGKATAFVLPSGRLAPDKKMSFISSGLDEERGMVRRLTRSYIHDSCFGPQFSV